MIKRWISRWRRSRDRAKEDCYPRITAQQWQLYQIDQEYRWRRPWIYSNLEKGVYK